MGRLIDFKVKMTTYNNAVCYKFDNRSILVSKNDEGCILRMQIIDKDPTPRVSCYHLKGKLHETVISIAHESAEALYYALKQVLNK